MRNKSWTKKEEEFLLALSKEETDSGEKFPPSIITVLFNDHFNRIVKDWNARSHGASPTKLRALLKLENAHPSNITVKFKAKKEKVKVKETKRGKNSHGDEPNSGRSWTPADDAYLVQNYTAHDDAQDKVAKHLGRSRKACYNRIRRLKNMNKIGMITMGSTLESTDDDEIEHMIVPEQRLPVTLLGYLVLWWRNRRKNKMIIKRRKLEEQLRRLS